MRAAPLLGRARLALTFPVLAREPGDPAAGRALAEEWCAECHEIEAGGAFKQVPPSFAAIAAYRPAEYIRANILFPHEEMPELAKFFGLDVDDVVAYLPSLEGTATDPEDDR